MIIDGDSVLLLKDSVILSEPWPSNQLMTVGRSDTAIKNEYLCRKLYISINLRRYDAIINTDPVLKIELPFSWTGHTGNFFIKLDSIPNDTTARYFICQMDVVE